MTYDEFKLELLGTGLTIKEFAALMGMPHRQSITNYSKVGVVPDHFAMIVLLMVALEDAGVDPSAVLGRVKLKRKLKRGAGFERGDTEDACK